MREIVLYTFKRNRGLKVRLKVCGNSSNICSIKYKRFEYIPFFVYFINMRHYMGNSVGFHIVLLSLTHFINIIKSYRLCVDYGVCQPFLLLQKRQYSRTRSILMFISAAERQAAVVDDVHFRFTITIRFGRVRNDATVTMDE